MGIGRGDSLPVLLFRSLTQSILVFHPSSNKRKSFVGSGCSYTRATFFRGYQVFMFSFFFHKENWEGGKTTSLGTVETTQEGLPESQTYVGTRSMCIRLCPHPPEMDFS